VKGLVMASGRKYPQELKDRAITLVGEAREQDDGLSVVRISKLVGVHADTLRVSIAEQTSIYSIYP
jgi:transposase